MNSKRFLCLLACVVFMCSSVVASAVEVPWGLQPYDIGSVIIGDVSDSSGATTYNITPPGSDDWGYTVITGMGYRGGTSSASNNAFNSASVSLDSEGYFVFPAGTAFNTYYDFAAFVMLSADDTITIDSATPCWIWVDMYIFNSSGQPVSQAVIDASTLCISKNTNANYGNRISLTSTDYLTYDASTGHLHGYVDFANGIGYQDISTYPFYMRFESTTYDVKQYSYRVSNIFFGKDKDLFTPPGPGSVEPDEPAEPTFEEQVLEDLDNIQANQQTQTDAISGAIQDQTDAMLSEDEETGLIGKLVKKIKELFIPSDEYFSDFWDRLNQFFADRFGFLWFPIEHFIDWIGRLMDLEDTQPTIAIPELGFEDHVLIPAQTYTFDFLASEPWATIHGYYLLAIDVAMIMAFVNLLGDKLKEVMNR